MNKVRIENKVNYQIKAKEVRLVGDNVTPGIYSFSEAIRISKELDLDLIEISAGETPVCRVINYSKFLYEKKKKLKEKNNQKNQETKELRFGANISEHDYQFKLKHSINFLTRGDIVKATIWFEGREMQHTDRGILVLTRLSDDLKNIGLADSQPKLEGRKMTLIVKPIKK